MGDGGIAFGASSGWLATGDIIAQTGATAAEAATSHNTFRFFDCDMHYSEEQVNVLIRSLQTSVTLDGAWNTNGKIHLLLKCFC